MGALGDMVNSAVGALTSSSSTQLKDFLNHFSPSDGKWIQQIDPKTTFELTMQFHPGPFETKEGEGEIGEKLASALDGLNAAAANMVKDAANNMTGGLLGAWANNRTSIEKQHDEFEHVSKETFMEFLATANLLAGQDTWGSIIGSNSVARPLEINLGLYCQDITLPQMEIPDAATSTTLFGEFPIPGNILKTNGQKVTLGILNTKVPLIERIFYPWMREVTLPYWSYETQPYTTATMTVDLTKHTDIKYVFCGCRPTYITLVQPNQQNTEVKRQVTMTFDYMYIASTMMNSESFGGKLLNSGMTLFNSGAKMMNF